MDQPALISVIVPTLNEGKQMGGLLDFLLARPGVEVIVSDGGSRDETVTICRHYPVKVVEGRPGRGCQLNAGAAQASGKVLFFLHADSRPRVEVFDQMRQAIEKGSRWGCCSLSFDRESRFLPDDSPRVKLAAQRGICYGDQGIFCQREWFMNQGGFPDLVFWRICLFPPGPQRESPPGNYCGNNYQYQKIRTGGPGVYLAAHAGSKDAVWNGGPPVVFSPLL